MIRLSLARGLASGAGKPQNPGRPQSRGLMLMLAVLLLLVMLLSVAVGAVFLQPTEVLAGLSGSGPNTVLLQRFRVPRVLAAVLAGGMLAVSGLILQVALRNRLASPDVVGVAKGAGFGAVVILMLAPVLFPPQSVVYLVPLAAVAGAVLVVLILLVIVRRGVAAATLALSGIALGALFQSLSSYMLIRFPGDTAQAMVWIAGSLYGMTYPKVTVLALWAALCLPALFWTVRILDVMQFSEITVTGLGYQPGRVRRALILLAAFLAAGAVAVVGPIAFLGLLAPHLARTLAGSRPAVLLPVTALLGGLLLALADLVGRVVVLPSEVPAGIVVSIIGAPYLLYVLRKVSRV